MERLTLRIAFGLALSIGLLGCTPNNKGSRIYWASLQLPGKSLELIDPSRIEAYQFLENGYIAASIGKKGSEIAAPLLYWKIENENLLIASDLGFENSETFSAPYFKDSVITVKRGWFEWDQFTLTITN